MSDTLNNYVNNGINGNEVTQIPLSEAVSYEVQRQAVQELKNNPNRHDLSYIQEQQKKQIEGRETGENIQRGSNILMRFGSGVYSAAPNVVMLPHEIVAAGAGLVAWAGDLTRIDPVREKALDFYEAAQGQINSVKQKVSQDVQTLPQKDRDSIVFGVGSAVPFFISGGAGAKAGGKIAKTIGKDVLSGQKFGASATGTAAEYYAALDENRAYGAKSIGGANDKEVADTLLAASQAFVAGNIERYLGWSGIVTIRNKTAGKYLKDIALTTASEGGGETLTSLSQTGLAFSGGRLDTASLPDEFKQAVLEGLVGAVLGMYVGSMDAFKHKEQAYQILENRYGKLISNPKEKKLVFDTLYKAQEEIAARFLLDTLKNSPELKAKHGDLYNALVNNIYKLVNETNADAFKNMSEDQKAQYISMTAQQQADTALLEAANRNMPVDQILNPENIVYEDGQIYLKNFGAGSPSSKVQISTKGADNDRVVIGDKQPQQEGEQPVILNQEVLADQAVKDGKNLPDIEARNINYNIDTKANRDVVIDVFNAIIPENERARYIDKEGYITPEGIIRVERAMLGSIIDDAVLLKQIVESQDESIKALTKALTDISSVINGLENRTRKGKLSDGYTIKDDIKKAVKKLVKAKLEGKSLSDIDMVDLTPSQKELLASFENAKSIKQIKNTIARYANVVDNVAKKRLFKGKKVPVSKDSILRTSRLHQEQVELADTMKELDRTNEEYTAETININSKERPVYNSEGNRIAKSEKALRAFYEWFGDSKVVDDQGRPLVVYHGTPNKFDTFDIEKFGKTDSGHYGKGFYFEMRRAFAKSYGKKVMKVYLKANNIFNADNVNLLEYLKETNFITQKKYKQLLKDSRLILDMPIKDRVFASKAVKDKEKRALVEYRALFSEALKEQGYDGIQHYTEFVVFYPNQIKSVDNRGTFDINNPNIYYQTIWAKKTDVTTKTDPKLMRDDAKKYLKDIVRNQNISHPRLGKIRVSSVGIKEFLHYTGNLDKLALVPHLKELIETSRVGAKEDLTHPRKDNIIAFYPLYNDAIIDGKPYNITIKIGVDNKGNLFYTLLFDDNNSSQNGETETKSSATLRATNISISQSDENVNSDGKLYQKAYVSMRGELVGDYLDADRFEGTGEGAMAHGWGSYLLKDRKTNKVRYFDRFNKPRTFVEYMGEEFDANVNKHDFYKTPKARFLTEYSDALRGYHGLTPEALIASKNRDAEWFLNNAKSRLEQYEKIYETNKDDAKISSGEKEFLQQKIKYEKETIKDMSEFLEFLKTFDSSKVKRVEKEAGAAQYEAEVPEDKFLLDEDLPLNKQSDYVQEKLKDVFNELKFPKKKEVIFNDPKTAKETYDIQMNLYQRNGYGYERLAPEIDDLPDGRIVVKFVENFNFYQTDEYTWKMSGRDAYDSFARYLKSQKSASKLLEKHGIKGIKYDGNRDGIGYVIFKGADAQITRRLLQRAFSGSRVDYEKPSLEYIGTGEGNQAHGWGLYYALSRAVAERYRAGFLSFIHKDRFVRYKGKTLADYFTEQDYVTYKAVKILSSGTSKEDAIKSMESFIEETKDNNVPLLYETKSENVEILKKLKEINVSDIEKLPVQKPQVHEVDIPENPYLLDEQKTLGEQSSFVKKALKEVAKEIGVKWDSRYNDGKYIYDNISNVLGSDKAASQLLEKHGVKGIAYEGILDGRCFVIFNPNDVKVIDKFYQATKAEGIDLNIDTRNGELERLVNLQETTNLGTNTRGDAFDKWVEDKFTKEALDEIENTTIYEAEDIFGSMEDANEEIADNPEGNSYGRKEPFTKEEFVEYYKNITRDNVDDRVRERINSTSSDEWSDLELEFGGSYDRDSFFESVQSYIEGVMFDNGFYTTTNKSNKSDSKYIEVYENEDADEPFARIRISDHYTHNFYGHNININTNNNLRDEMQKLQNAFRDSEFGVDDTVWQSLEDKQRKTTLKGFYDLATKSIGITKDADFSTLPHEFAHFWFDNMFDYVNSGEASAEYIERFEAVKKFVGLKDGERPTEKHHEKFARAYEKMLLTGTAPNVKIIKVFEEYKEFIEDVYNNVVEVDEKYGEKYEPLTEDMYNFFNSMVGHSLPRPKHFAEDIEANKVMAQKVDEDVDAVIEEEINTIDERAGNYIKMPVQTDNKTGYLTAYNKVTGENVMAGSATLKVEEERAREFVLNNPQQAYDIVMGFAPKPEGYISNLIYKAYIDLQKQLGNTKHRAEVTINKALELRSEGQDISSEQLETDFVKPTNVISTVINRKTDKVAKRNNKTRKELSDYVKKEVRKAWHEGKKPEEIVKKLADKLTVKPREAKLVKSNNDTYAFKNLLKYVEDSLGMGMSTEEAIEIIRIADDMNTNLKNSMSETGNPSIEYFIKLRELENYVNKLAPSSVWRVLVSVIGRGNLLASLKSPVTNIVSTLPTNIFMAGTRRLVLGVNTSIVDPKLVKQARKEAWEIYKQTGYHLFSMEDVTKGTRGILGENLSHSQGEGAIRALGRFYEKLIYDFSLGRPDVLFKNFTFTDYASLKATKLSGGDKKKANELFEDACRVEPLTDEGKEIRKEAVNEALVATYQNNGALSETLLKARDVFSFGVGFGEFIAPFVKTPANIVETSVNMAFGVPRAIISETVRSIQRGEITAWTSQNIRYCIENGLGVLLAIAVASLLDDDDYMPAYALASNRDKELARELNIPYNSVRLGDTWYSLDYLGVLAAPLVSVLQARKSEDIMGAMWNYGKGGLLQATTIPVLGSISDIVDNIEKTLKKEGEEVAEDMLTGTIEGLYSRTVPMIVSDIAKALDPYEREKSGFGIQQNIPFAREELPKKVSVTSGEAEKLGNPFIDLFAGARIKEQVRNDVADELKRLNDAGFGVTLKDVTKGTKFSDLDEETKQEVRVRYAEEYSERVDELINSDEYQELEDAEKSQAIGKIRTRIMKELREEFL